MWQLRHAGIRTLCLASACAAITLGSAAQTPSTPDERERVIQLAHKLEVNPLDENLIKEREWALKWLIQVPDVHVKMCSNVLGDFYKSKYKHSPEITSQEMLSSAAFVMEHPNEASDNVAQYLAGVEGTLRAYKSILQSKPKDTSKALDVLVQKQSEGKLVEYVRNAGQACK